MRARVAVNGGAVVGGVVAGVGKAAVWRQLLKGPSPPSRRRLSFLRKRYSRRSWQRCRGMHQQTPRAAGRDVRVRNAESRNAAAEAIASAAAIVVVVVIVDEIVSAIGDVVVNLQHRSTRRVIQPPSP